MTKLLDYRVDKDLKEKIHDLVDEDLYMLDTPDLPALRFAGPQLVFLWDECKHADTLKDLDVVLDQGKDFHTLHWVSETASSHRPVKCVSNSNSRTYEYLNFARQDWHNTSDEKTKAVVEKIRPRPIAGRVISVSLKGMTALDMHYRNGALHRRVKAKVYHNRIRNEDKAMYVWMYYANLNYIGSYDPHQQEYRFPNYQSFSAVHEQLGNYMTPAVLERKGKVG